MKNALSNLPLILFLLLIGFVFGANGSASQETAETSLKFASLWAIIALILLPRSRLIPQLQLVGLISLLAILGFGWLMVLNARAGYSMSTFSFTLIEDRFWKGGPGAATQEASSAKMLEVSGLFLVFLAAVRSRESEAWKKFLAVFPIMGALITLVGLYHRVVGAPSVWFVDEIHPATFFAPYIYNANAGSVLNFSGALAFSFWIASFGQAVRAKGIFWSLITLMCFLGAVATGSKGAFLVMVLTLGFSVFAHRARLSTILSGSFRGLKKSGIESKVLLITMVLITMSFVAAGLPVLISRVTEFLEDAQDGNAGTVEGRLGIMKVMSKMARLDEGGFVGFGPGSFPSLVPYFLADKDYFIPGRWIHGHCDPLQLIVEWGYLGAALWLVFGVGAIVQGGLSLRNEAVSSLSRPLVRGMMIAIASLVIHSSFDFPFGLFSIKFAAVVVLGMLWSNHHLEEPRQE